MTIVVKLCVFRYFLSYVINYYIVLISFLLCIYKFIKSILLLFFFFLFSDISDEKDNKEGQIVQSEMNLLIIWEQNSSGFPSTVDC